MASRVVVYFAGIGTVVVALGVGFAGAIMLTSTTPVQKVPAAAFAKREQPVEPQAWAPAAVAPEPQTPAPVAVVAPPPAPASSGDLPAGVAPLLTALPVPTADAVARALALNPPPADPAIAPAKAATSRPAETVRPVVTPDDSPAAKTKERHDDGASEQKPDRKLVERKPTVAEKPKAGRAGDEDEQRVRDEDEPAAETTGAATEPDRPTREGF